MILQSLNIEGVEPMMGLSQQFETQRDNNLVEAIYDGWLVSFVVQVQD